MTPYDSWYQAHGGENADARRTTVLVFDEIGTKEELMIRYCLDRGAVFTVVKR